MPEITDFDIVEEMARYGGSFVQTLAALWIKGDEENRRKIRETWLDVF